MKRMMVIAALVAPLLVAGSPQATRAADVGISIRIGDRYQGSELHFTNQPRMVVIPRTRVYYIQDYDVDVYRYGRYYYAYDRGRWYRATSYRGPWFYIRGRSVPVQIYTIPSDYRRNWQGDYSQWRNRDYDENWQQYWGHGNRGRDMNRGREMNRARDVSRARDVNRATDANHDMDMNRGQDMNRGANPADEGNQKDKGKKGKDKGDSKGQGNRGH
ncbi:MAG: hypothetical protein ACM3PF_02420 [Bacteroidota bacterium]